MNYNDADVLCNLEIIVEIYCKEEKISRQHIIKHIITRFV